MIVTSHFDALFRAIRTANLNNRGTVLILCAPDCDALCAYRIITRLLAGQPTQFEGVPVRRFDDLEQANKNSVANRTEHKSLILLNCGAVYDLESTFSLSDAQTVYVIDSHRPYHLNNVYSQKIVLVDDGTGQEEVEALRQGKDDRNDTDDKGDDNDDNDDDDDDDVFDSDEEEEEEEEYDFENGPPRQRRRVDTILQRHRMKRRIKRYYSKSYYGPCSAMLAYMIARELNHTDNELLWCSIVGLTDQLTHERIDLRRYSAGVELLKDEVFSRNAAHVDLNKSAIEDEGKTSLLLGDDFISFDPQENRFVLLQYWNIFESMSNSRYIFSALRLWKESGRSRLKELFVKMGISLEQSKQFYRSMDVEARRLFHEHIQSYAKEEFGMDDLVFDSFTRQQGFKFKASASDVVHCVTTLLEHPYNLGSEDDVGDATDDNIWKTNFWKAYEALTGSEQLFTRGVQISITLQKSITEQASSILEKKSLIKSGPFRYTFLTENISDFFLKPIPLVQLAFFLLDTLKQQKRVDKPLVICAFNEQTSSYLVVGVTPTRNSAVFATAFKKANQMTPQQSQVRLICFDSWVVEVSKPFLPRFMYFLHWALA